MRSPDRGVARGFVAVLSVLSACSGIACGGSSGPRGTVATPIFSPGATAFGSPLQVELATATSGASLFYTLDGTAPSASSSPYQAPVTVTATTTINAIAVHPDLDDSAVASATYTLAPTSLAIDDGTFGGYWSAGSGDELIMWLNRITPAEGQLPLLLARVQVLFNQFAHVGDRIELLVYQDGDGDPSNGATLLTAFEATVQHVDEATWSDFALPVPLVLTGPEDLLVAVVDRWVADGVSVAYPASSDGGSCSGRSWIGTWSSTPPDPPPFPPDALWTENGFDNYLIRASN